VIGDREPLGWILTQEQMAFPAHRSREVVSINTGDRLFLYTTRGCFRNPSIHRGRVIAEATVTSPVSLLDEPASFGEHLYPLGCTLHITGLAPRDKGPEMVDLIDKLHLFADLKPEAWGTRLRRVLAPIDKHDASILHRKLRPLMRPPTESTSPYLRLTSFSQASSS